MIGKMISAEFNREKLVCAISAVNSVQMDSELGFVQIYFTGNEKVVFSSMNKNTSVLYETNVEHQGNGIIKIPGKQFLEYIRVLPQTTISANIERQTQLNLNCGSSSAKIQLVQDEIFTSLIPVGAGSAIRLKGELLARWISSFKDFISYDDFRFYINGALIWAETSENNPTLHSVASDTFRLSYSTIFEDIEIIDTNGGEVLVPKRVLEELRRMASSEPEKTFELKWNAREISFTAETEGYMLSAKCITGVYPAYKSAFPKSISASIEINLKELLGAIKRSLIFAQSQDKIISLRFSGKTLKISNASPSLREAQEVIDLDAPVKHNFEVLYSGQYLAGILTLLSGSFVTFHWENAEKSVKITGESERGLSSFYLLVPARY